MRPNRVQQVLIEARALLARPYGWTKERNSQKRKLPRGGNTTAYCSYGAIDMAARMLHARGITKRTATIALASATGDRPISTWNDAPGRRKREVLAAFDVAIEQAGV